MYLKRKVWLSLVMISPLLCGCSKLIYNSITDYDKYVTKVNKAENFMPSLNSLKDYINADVFYTSYLSIFPYESINLTLNYAKDDYFAEKAHLNNYYNFLSEPIVSVWEDEKYFIPEIEFEIYDFTIKVVEKDIFDYPHSFGMLGFSDKELKICYLYYYDSDLDFINNMESFTKSSFTFSK